jgi:hypothetical protein
MNHYTNAVHNFEKLVDKVSPQLRKDQLEILRYNIFILKLQPQYQKPEPELETVDD